MENIELILMLKDDYDNWRKECQKQVSPKLDANSQIGATWDDLVGLSERIPYPPRYSLSFQFNADTKLKDVERELFRQMRPVLSETIQKGTFGQKIVRFLHLIFSLGMEFEFSYPSISSVNKKRTLHDLGFSSGDIIVLGYSSLPLLSIYIAEPMFNALANSALKAKDLVDFLDGIICDERHSRRVDMWTYGEPRPSSIVGGVVLYTEEDVELAHYVRQHYAPLHVLSGNYMTLYFFEYMPSSKSDQASNVREFWAGNLPSKLNNIWSFLGLTKTKPHLNEKIYSIAEGIGVTPDYIPCIVFFKKWKEIKENRIILRITQPYPQFFRRTCTDIVRAVESYKGEENDEGFLKAFALQEFRHYLPDWWNGNQGVEVSDVVAKKEKLQVQKKILFLFACPKDANRIRVDEEERVVRECFERSQLRDLIAWSSRHAVRVDDLRRAILDEEPNIIHFSGHGTGGTIVLENEQGNSYPVPIDALGHYLSNRNIDCVILNACTTKALGQAIGGTVTISMPNPISDRAAIEFTRGFYDRIGTGGSIQQAYEEGKLNLELKGFGEEFSAEYLKP